MADRQNRMQELLAFDRQYRKMGIVVAGMDEVGRGPLAGNVVTACVVLPDDYENPWIDDSKKLSEKRRDAVYQDIMKNALYVGIGEVEPAVIDQINIHFDSPKKCFENVLLTISKQSSSISFALSHRLVIAPVGSYHASTSRLIRKVSKLLSSSSSKVI